MDKADGANGDHNEANEEVGSAKLNNRQDDGDPNEANGAISAASNNVQDISESDILKKPNLEVPRESSATASCRGYVILEMVSFIW